MAVVVGEDSTSFLTAAKSISFRKPNSPGNLNSFKMAERGLFVSGETMASSLALPFFCPFDFRRQFKGEHERILVQLPPSLFPLPLRRGLLSVAH